MIRVCTIVATNYLAQARVLCDSVRQQHADAEVSVLVVDARAEELDESFDVLTPADLDLTDAEFATMAAIYDVTELCCAVKPWLLESLLSRGPDPVLFLDPDCVVYAPIDDLLELADNAALVLTPHLLDPIPDDGLRPSETDILAGGTFNLGFIGVGTHSAAFLSWWKQHLRRDCIADVANNVFVDQRWIDLASQLFSTAVVRDRGVNVAYWNVSERPIESTPIRIFHFSGYDPDQPDTLSRHQLGRGRAVPSGALRSLSDAYAASLRAAGHQPDTSRYRFAKPPDQRRAFRDALLTAEAAGRDLSFDDWLASRNPRSATAPRKWVGYSWAPPGEDGDSGIDAGITLQQAAASHRASSLGWIGAAEYSDEATSETRPNAAAAIEHARRDDAVLIVVRSEALPGGLTQLAALVDEALVSLFDVVAVDIGVDTTTEGGRSVARYLIHLYANDVPEAATALPPPALRYRVAGAGNGEWFHRSGYHTLLDFERGLDVVGRSIDEFNHILDFGCGCGRVMRHAATRVPVERLSGADIDAEAAQWLAAALPEADVRATDGLPPLPFNDGAFDLVVGYSVFSHLDAKYQDRWLEELRRVTTPGATLLLTVNGPLSFEWHAAGPLADRKDLGRLRRRFNRKQFAFWDGDGWERWFPDYYHSAWHTPDYVRRHWSKWFRVVDVLEGAAGSTQDLVVLER